MTERIKHDSVKAEQREKEYQDILVQGSPAKPTVQQIDALISLLVQIAQRANKEDTKSA